MVAALVSAVVGALVGAALSPVTNNVMAQIFKLVEKDRELWEGFKKDMVSLEKDLHMLIAEGVDQLSGERDPSTWRRIFKKDMQELSYDIQDCMDRILCYSECGRGHSRDFAKEVKKLMERLEHANKQQNRNNVDDSQLPLKPDMLRGEKLVGIEEPMEDLLNVLKGHPHEALSVISIAGFSGFGKTTLARAVYDDCSDQFDCRAWVVATEHKSDATELFVALQEELSKKDQEYPQGGNVENNITNFLKNKRFLIVLDDIEERQWNNIKSVFPKEKRSRIIVTTTNQAVANLCSKHGRDGYVYNVKPLEKTHAKELLDAILKDTLAVSYQNLAQIEEKFDGHPHSLLSVAKYLLKKEEFPGTFWDDLGDRMNDPDEHAFTGLHRVLTEHFRNLRGRHDVNLKIMLLYMCVFPNTHPVGRSRLIRRWLAEGYVQDDDPHKALHFADDNLDKLIELNIVRRIDPSKNAKVKTCRVHGIMHEFLLHIARSIDFITDLNDRQRRKYRHLFLDGRPSIGGVSNVSGKSSDEEELRAHSLTVCGTAANAAGYFPKCELLRVLDLEECNELEDEHTVDIHMLWHLKYLSLGAKITKVPTDIEKLHCLETLDLRKTQIKVLPVGVIKLPQLAHLLGKFKLEERNWDNIKADNFLPPRSNLRTLTGFLTDDDPGFPKLMVHMKELNKVKIWCTSKRANASTPTNQNSVGSIASTPDSPSCEDSGGASSFTSDSAPSECFTFLLTAIMFFIQSRLDTPGVDHCLSLYLGNSSKDILNSLHNSLQLSRDHSPGSRYEISCAYLSSLKLYGELYGLTQIISLVGGLKELCISSTNGLTLEEVSNLTKLEALEYLKLVNISLGVITSDDFKILRRLCLVECKDLPIIENGALSNLLSLRILNKDLKGLSNIEIKNLKRLQEVGLHSDVMRKTKTDWEDAAKKHPRRPRLLFFKMVDSAERAPDAGSSCVMLEEEQIRTDGQSMVVVEDMLTAQENRNDISSDSQNPNARAADVHGKIFDHYTADKNDVEGQNDENHIDLRAMQTKKKSEGWVSRIRRKISLRKSTVTSAVNNSLAKGKGSGAPSFGEDPVKQ